MLPAATLKVDDSTLDATEIPSNPPPLKESDLYGLYLQADTGVLLEFKPEGKFGGWPSAGSYKIVGPNRVELLQQVAGKEERLPVQLYPQKEGLIMVRNVHGESETVPLHRLDPTKLDLKAWQGDCKIHVLQSGEKIATRRVAKLMEDGYLRTPEGGFWLRLMMHQDGKQTIGFTSELQDQTHALYVYKTGPLLVVFDRLEKPNLLAIIQLGQTSEAPTSK
jgi:hypothetical protein